MGIAKAGKVAKNYLAKGAKKGSSSILSGRHTKRIMTNHAMGKKVPVLGKLGQWVEPEWENLFIGAQTKRSTDIAAFAGLSAFGAAAGMGAGVVGAEGETKAVKQQIKGMAEDTGSLPGMSGDAAGNSYMGKRDLGATGDIVFGLHNGRRSRY